LEFSRSKYREQTRRLRIDGLEKAQLNMAIDFTYSAKERVYQVPGSN